MTPSTLPATRVTGDAGFTGMMDQCRQIDATPLVDWDYLLINRIL